MLECLKIDIYCSIPKRLKIYINIYDHFNKVGTIGVQNKNNSCDGDDFSHVYIIGHQYFCLQEKTQTMSKWVEIN